MLSFSLTCPVFDREQQEHLAPWQPGSGQIHICPHKCPAPACRKPLLWRTSPTEHEVQLAGGGISLQLDGLDQELSLWSPRLFAKLEQPESWREYKFVRMKGSHCNGGEEGWWKLNKIIINSIWYALSCCSNIKKHSNFVTGFYDIKGFIHTA